MTMSDKVTELAMEIVLTKQKLKDLMREWNNLDITKDEYEESK